MKIPTDKPRHAGRNDAFTLGEILLALTITAMLMAALATAMQASLHSYKENEELSTVTQTARSILNRMSREVRTAEAISFSAGLLTVLPPDDGSGITQIEYEQVGDELIYRITKNGTEATQALIATTDEVAMSALTIDQEVGQNWEGFDCTKAITMNLTLAASDRTYAYTATARPRRNLLQ